MTDSILTVTDGHVGIITIDRPDKLNALTLDMVKGVRAAAAAFDEDPEVWVILLRSSGERAFCVGGDLVDMLPKILDAGEDVMNPNPRTRFFSDVYTPIVVAVQGLCLGGGFEIMLGTDIRIAADNAVFALPEVGIGLIPGSGTNVRLPRQLPWPQAMELLLTGTQIDAANALARGLINEVVPAAELGIRALERAQAMTANGPFAMRAAKQIAVRSLALDEAFAMEYAVNTSVIGSEDARTGVLSFASKTTPQFHNR